MSLLVCLLLFIFAFVFLHDWMNGAFDEDKK